MSYHKENESQGHSLEVYVRYTGDSKEERDSALEKALSHFKKLVNNEGLMQEIKEREYYETPGRKRYLHRQSFYFRVAKENAKRQFYAKKSLATDKIDAQNQLRMLQQKTGKPVPVIPLNKKGNKPNDRRNNQGHPRTGGQRPDRPFYRKQNPHTFTQRKPPTNKM